MLRAAIWGAGTIAHTHAKVLRELGISIALVVAPRLEKAKAFAKLYGIERYSDRNEDLLEASVDCVHICTPPKLRFEMISTLLQQGKHIFCEKPLCLNPAEAEQLCALAERKGLLHGVDFNCRYHRAVQEARQLVQSEQFGTVRLVHGTYLQEFHALPAQMDWRYNSNLAGQMRAVTEIGSHWTDLCQYITGRRIVAVSAVFSNFAPKRSLKDGLMQAETEGCTPVEVSSEDAAVIQLRLDNGAIGSVVLCEAASGRVNHLTMEVTGDHGNVWWDSEQNNTLHFGKKGQGVRTTVYPFAGGFEDSQRSLLTEFYNGLAHGGKPTYPTFFDGAYNVKICDAIYYSATHQGVWTDVEGKR